MNSVSRKSNLDQSLTMKFAPSQDCTCRRENIKALRHTRRAQRCAYIISMPLRDVWNAHLVKQWNEVDKLVKILADHHTDPVLTQKATDPRRKQLRLGYSCASC
jgi:hypothetical protein